MLKKIITFTILILLGFALVLFWLGGVRFNDFYKSQKSVAQESTNIVHLEIEKQLEQKRLLVEIFLEDHYKLISSLAINPQDEQLFIDLNTKLERFFPDYFSASIATENGTPVIDDFDGNLGQLCIDDMEHFSKHKEQLIRIHPNQNIYHYDVLAPFVLGVKNMIFFVSFSPGNVASLLLTSQSNEHKLILAQTEREYLIEVVDQGARDKLTERLDYRLDESEKSRILSSDHVAGTLWDVLDLHEPDLFEGFKKSLIQESLVIYFIFSAIFLFMAGILYSGERKRAGAENQLQQKNKDIVELNNKLSTTNKELEQLSITDGLTGIFNRRYLDDKLSEEWERAKRLGFSLTFVLIDVDCFKQYNDLYGHQAGDECLQEIAKILKKTFRRAGDFVARYGGEEFAVVTLVDNKETSFEQVDKFRASVEARRIENKDSKVCGYITVSAGVAHVVPDITLSVNGLIKEADEALYKAKTNGRNQVVSTCQPENTKKPAG